VMTDQLSQLLDASGGVARHIALLVSHGR
jgi:hypothetical protein